MTSAAVTTKLAKEKVIMGIDPGTNVMGYGIIHVVNHQIKVLSLGAVHIKEEDSALKLKTIFERTLQLVDEYKPDELAIEAPFFGKNVQSMLKLGRAQGVAMAAALTREIPITEYSPRKVKQSITGSGAASKEQVAAMIGKLCKLEILPKQLDATDGLAVAVCHHFQSSAVIQKSGSSGWKSFIKQHPDRLH